MIKRNQLNTNINVHAFAEELEAMSQALDAGIEFRCQETLEKVNDDLYDLYLSFKYMAQAEDEWADKVSEES